MVEDVLACRPWNAHVMPPARMWVSESARRYMPRVLPILPDPQCSTVSWAAPFKSTLSDSGSLVPGAGRECPLCQRVGDLTLKLHWLPGMVLSCRSVLSDDPRCKLRSALGLVMSLPGRGRPSDRPAAAKRCPQTWKALGNRTGPVVVAGKCFGFWRHPLEPLPKPRCGLLQFFVR